MHPLKKAARIAGAIYLSMIVTGPFSLIYVPTKLIVRGDATATASNILAQPSEVECNGAEQFLWSVTSRHLTVKEKGRPQESLIVTVLSNAMCDGALSGTRYTAQKYHL